MRSPITYYGGKTKMVGLLLEMIPKHRIYTESFFGGGALFFAKRPSFSETINDKLGMVVNFYRVLKEEYSSLEKMIHSSLMSRDLFNKARKVINNYDEYDIITCAWAFWYVCNFSYMNKIGGGLRYSNDQYVCEARTINNKKKDFTRLLQKRIENAYIENRDALEVISSRDTEDSFHFIDPPYMNADQGHYKGYSEAEFESLLNLISNCKGKFLLTNFHSDILFDYIDRNGWHVDCKRVRASGVRKGNRPKDEILVWNYDLPNKVNELF